MITLWPKLTHQSTFCPSRHEIPSNAPMQLSEITDDTPAPQSDTALSSPGPDTIVQPGTSVLDLERIEADAWDANGLFGESGSDTGDKDKVDDSGIESINEGRESREF